MNMLRMIVTIILAGILTNNYVLSKFLGICPFLGVSKKLNTAMGMSAAVIFVMVLSTAVTYPIQRFVLEALGLEYLQTIVFILIIAALVQLVEIVLKKYIPTLHASLGVYLPLITTNCAVLGCAILVTEDYSSAVYGFGIRRSPQANGILRYSRSAQGTPDHSGRGFIGSNVVSGLFRSRSHVIFQQRQGN